MKKPVKICLITLLTLTNLLTSFFVFPKAAAYTPPYTTLKVGLYFGSTALPSANLQNVTGFGSGYQFGYLDAQRNFVPLGAQTSETKITMLGTKHGLQRRGKRLYPGSEGSLWSAASTSIDHGYAPLPSGRRVSVFPASSSSQMAAFTPDRHYLSADGQRRIRNGYTNAPSTAALPIPSRL
jgi:hypothetical protein